MLPQLACGSFQIALAVKTFLQFGSRILTLFRPSEVLAQASVALQISDLVERRETLSFRETFAAKTSRPPTAHE
jgi:hypothetical protein